MADTERLQALHRYKEMEQKAETLIPIIGALYRDSSVLTMVCARPLVNKSTVEIIKAHNATKHLSRSISVFDTYPVLYEVQQLAIRPCRLDIGHLTLLYYERQEKAGKFLSMRDFLSDVLADVLSRDPFSGVIREVDAQGNGITSKPHKAKDVVLYGFGRIGRLVARILIEKTGGGEKLMLRAVILRKIGDLDKRASSLRRDSVHGPFIGTIKVDTSRNIITANGVMIQFIESAVPGDVDLTKYHINDAILIDNTGVWRDSKGLSRHLEGNGVARVILTAPVKGEDIPDIVMGVNDKPIPDSPIVGAASCTTNAVVPVLLLLHERFRIVDAHIETIHSYTNDQNLVDNYHDKARRGRAAALNMVITETGSSSAVGRAIPELKGKVTGNAIRVPTAVVSLAILNLNIEEEASVETVNSYLRTCCLSGRMAKQLDYQSSPELASSDFVGSRAACIIDSCATIAHGKRLTIYLWYDNESGYSCQVVRLAQAIGGIDSRHPQYPKETPQAVVAYVPQTTLQEQPLEP